MSMYRVQKKLEDRMALLDAGGDLPSQKGAASVAQQSSGSSLPHSNRREFLNDRITIRSIILLVTVAILLGSPALLSVRAAPTQGMYFAKKQYVPKSLPKFSETKGKLP